MSIISKPNTFSANTTISSSEVNDNFDTIYNDYNGGIAAANLASDSVTTAKIADSNVTAAKLASGAVTTAKITDLAVSPDKTTVVYYSGTDATATGTNSTFADNDANTTLSVVTTASGAIARVVASGNMAYAAATGTVYARVNITGANTATTQTREATMAANSQRVPFHIDEFVVLTNAGTTTFALQRKGSASSSNVIEAAYISVEIVQGE